jgi:PilZ domain
MNDETVFCESPCVGTGDRRCDAGADECARPKADWERLHTLFRDYANEPPVNLRRETRHSAVEYRAWMGWWQNTHDFLIVAARLINISRGGAMLVLADPPPPHESVWICLGLSEPDDCARATVLDVRETGQDGEQAVRLTFQTPCSESFFRMAIDGLARESCQGALAQGPGE